MSPASTPGISAITTIGSGAANPAIRSVDLLQITDARGASFVSVTQQFNTTTSMANPFATRPPLGAEGGLCRLGACQQAIQDCQRR
jgi:hypothetical protein